MQGAGLPADHLDGAEIVAGAEAALAAFAASADGQRYPDHRAPLAPEVGGSHPGLCLPAGHSAHPDDDERDREPAPAAGQDAQDPGPLPPADQAALKLLYLALRNIKARWGAAPEWKAALPHFSVLFPERFEPEP